MNKEEWRELSGAARLLMKARFARYDDNAPFRKQPQKDIVWDITYSHIVGKMHPSIAYSIFNKCDQIYNLKDNKWAIKHNSTCFEAIRTKNYLAKLD